MSETAAQDASAGWAAVLPSADPDVLTHVPGLGLGAAAGPWRCSFTYRDRAAQDVLGLWRRMAQVP